MRKKTKLQIVLSSQIVKGAKNVKGTRKLVQYLEISFFRVRRCTFSLHFRAIRLLEFFGARRKVALRGEAYEWTSVLRTFDKLREVGVLFYLVLHFV